MNPLVVKILRTALVGLGGSLVVSAVVNIIGAVQLIEPSDEAMIGLTRTEVIRTFSILAVIGIAMIYFGMRSWTKKPPKVQRPKSADEM